MFHKGTRSRAMTNLQYRVWCFGHIIRSTAGSDCKSRINFLGMLRAGNKDYVLNPTALDYMKTRKRPKAQMELLTGCKKRLYGLESGY